MEVRSDNHTPTRPPPNVGDKALSRRTSTRHLGEVPAARRGDFLPGLRLTRYEKEKYKIASLPGLAQQVP